MSDSHFLDELESLLFANDQDEFQDVYSARKSKKKRMKTISTADSIPPLKRLTRGLPLGGTYNYAMLFSSALNTNSSLIMRQMLHEPLQPLNRVSKYLQKRSADGGKTTDIMTFSTANEFFAYNDQFVDFVQGTIYVKSISSFTHPTKGTTMICVNFTYEGVFLIPMTATEAADNNNDSTNNTSANSGATAPNMTKSETIYLEERPSNIGVHVEEGEVVSTDSLASSSVEFSDSEMNDTILSGSDISDLSLSGEESDGSEGFHSTSTPTTGVISGDTAAKDAVSVSAAGGSSNQFPFSAKGSYILHLNEENKIYAMEFFYSFLS